VSTLVEQIESEVERIGCGGSDGVVVLEVEKDSALVEFNDGSVSQTYRAVEVLTILKTLRTNLADGFADDGLTGAQETAEQKAYEAFWVACRTAETEDSSRPTVLVLERPESGWLVEVVHYASGMVSVTETAPDEALHRREGRHDGGSVVAAIVELAYKRLIDSYETQGFGSKTWRENLERFQQATQDWK
jgi:hypothetical protein